MELQVKRYLPGLLAGLLFVSGQCEASWWNPISWFRRPRVHQFHTVVVTGNYVKSRLLAELIQVETKQPVILLPGPNDERLFALGPDKQALALSRDQYVRFVVGELRPKKVLFLGNTKYVPQEYVEELRAQLPVWAITNDDWEEIAISCGEVFKLKKLALDYLVLLRQMEEAQKLDTPEKPKAPVPKVRGW